jgi:single-strand DNA-binding protein
MKSLNKVQLIGNLGKDPEIRISNAGQMVANLSIATENSFKDAKGVWQEATTWHSLVAFGRTAEIIRDYVRKGSRIYVEGRIQTRSWDQDGQTRYRTEIVVNELLLLSGKPDADAIWPKTETEVTDEDIPF